MGRGYHLGWGPTLADQLFSIGSTDAWVGQFDAATGASRWLKQGGSQLDCLLTGLSISPTGDLAALGTYQLGAIFDTRPAMSVVSGYTGTWLAQRPSTCRLGAPTATGPAAPLCVGESFTLTATNLPAGATPTWSGPNGFSSTQPTVTVPASSVAVGGIYTLAASAGALTVTQQPQTGGVLLTSSAASGNQWYQDGQPIPGATNPTLLATTAAQYTVRVTGSEGCQSAPSAPSGVAPRAQPCAAWCGSEPAAILAKTIGPGPRIAGRGRWFGGWRLTPVPFC